MQQEQRTKRGIRPKQAAAKLGVSDPTFWRYVRTIPDFPKAVKLSPAVTIFDEDELDAFIARRAAGAVSPLKRSPPDGKVKAAAAALGARLVADLTPSELRAWTAAGRPCRVSLGGVELVLLKAIERAVASAAAPAGVVPVEAPRKRGRPRKHPVEVVGAMA